MCSVETDSHVQEAEKKPAVKSKFFRERSLTSNSKPKTLEIHLLDSKVLKEGTSIKITPDEINGQRHNPDDSFHFGREQEGNDYCFPEEEKMAEKQFKIKYNESSQSYSIQDYFKGTGLFVHINGREMISSTIACFANNQMIVSVDNETNMLHLQFLKGEHKGRLHKINPLEITMVGMGRSKKSEITFRDPNVSRNQCTFMYENHTWYMYDGIPGQPSTNGVWLLANKSVNIKNGLIFKTGFSTFVAKVY